MSIYSEKIEALIDAALADGVLTEKEKQILFKKAQDEGIDLDEFEMVLDARIVELQKKKQSEKEKAAPKSEKYGDVRKCPSCGAIVPAFKGVCPECGYEFSGVDANLSSKQLALAIQKAKSYGEKREVIETFPIPNTKSDLLEFLTALKPRVEDVNSDFSDSYFKKYSECIEKVKVAYLDDKMMRPFAEAFPSIVSKRKKGKVLGWMKSHKALVGIVLAVILIGGGEIIGSIYSSVKEKRLNNKVAAAINSGIDDEIIRNASNYKSINLDLKKQVVEKLVDEGRIQEAVVFFDKAGHLSMGNMVWHSQALEDYTKSTAKIVRYGLYSIGEYEKAWEYYPLNWSTTTSVLNAERRFQFMVEALNFILKNNGKNEARRFLKDGVEWFRTYVDNDKELEKHKDYMQFKYQQSKQKLTAIINEY